MSSFGSIPTLLAKGAELCLEYAFDASAKTIAIDDPLVNRVLLVVNVTDGLVIYNPANPGTTGTWTTKILSLTYDTTGMSDTDELYVLVDRIQQDSIPSLIEAVAGLRKELALLNARFEETFETNLDYEDM